MSEKKKLATVQGAQRHDSYHLMSLILYNGKSRHEPECERGIVGSGEKGNDGL